MLIGWLSLDATNDDFFNILISPPPQLDITLRADIFKIFRQQVSLYFSFHFVVIHFPLDQKKYKSI